MPRENGGVSYRARPGARAATRAFAPRRAESRPGWRSYRLRDARERGRLREEPSARTRLASPGHRACAWSSRETSSSPATSARFLRWARRPTAVPHLGRATSRTAWGTRSRRLAVEGEKLVTVSSVTGPREKKTPCSIANSTTHPGVSHAAECCAKTAGRRGGVRRETTTRNATTTRMTTTRRDEARDFVEARDRGRRDPAAGRPWFWLRFLTSRDWFTSSNEIITRGGGGGSKTRPLLRGEKSHERPFVASVAFSLSSRRVRSRSSEPFRASLEFARSAPSILISPSRSSRAHHVCVSTATCWAPSSTVSSRPRSTASSAPVFGGRSRSACVFHHALALLMCLGVPPARRWHLTPLDSLALSVYARRERSKNLAHEHGHLLDVRGDVFRRAEYPGVRRPAAHVSAHPAEREPHPYGHSAGVHVLGPVHRLADPRG